MSGKKKEKDGGEGMSVKKRILEVTIFLLVMFLTFYTLFSGKNLGEIANAVSKMSVGYLVPAAALAIFCMRRRIYDLVSASGNESKPKKRRKFFDSLYPILFYRIFLFWHYAVCNRRTACAALLYEQRREQRIGQYGCAYDSCCCL